MLSIKYLTRFRAPVTAVLSSANQNRRWWSSEDSVPKTVQFPVKQQLREDESLTGSLQKPTTNPVIVEESPARDVSATVLRFDENNGIVHQKDLEIDWENEMQTIVREEEHSSPFDLVEETLSVNFEPALRPTFNLAAYINQSLALRELLKLGVDLSKIEKQKDVSELYLKLDLHRDIRPMLSFLTKHIGVSPDKIGAFLTANPYIFQADLDDLEIRVNYLSSKRFTPENIARIVEANPHWLMHSTKDIDERLGFFQQKFRLNGSEVRALVIMKPTIITCRQTTILQTEFTFLEECGLGKYGVKQLLLKEPGLFMKGKLNFHFFKQKINLNCIVLIHCFHFHSDRPVLLERYDFAIKKMKLTNQDILRAPELLDTRLFRLQERHGFLKSLGRAQYNPTLDLYISPKDIVVGADADFAINVAKSTPEEFDAFLRTL